MFVSSIFSDCLEGQQVESLIKAEMTKTRGSSAVAGPYRGLQGKWNACTAATLYPNSQTYAIFIQKGRNKAQVFFPQKLTDANKNRDFTMRKPKHSSEFNITKQRQWAALRQIVFCPSRTVTTVQVTRTKELLPLPLSPLLHAYKSQLPQQLATIEYPQTEHLLVQGKALHLRRKFGCQ